MGMDVNMLACGHLQKTEYRMRRNTRSAVVPMTIRRKMRAKSEDVKIFCSTVQT